MKINNVLHVLFLKLYMAMGTLQPLPPPILKIDESMNEYMNEDEDAIMLC